MTSIVWPAKQREISGALNSALWSDFEFRDDDIVIATVNKSGTTLMQQIVGQLVMGGDHALYAQAISPWIEGVPMPNARALAEGQTHRRFLKAHLPIDALVYSPRAKYIFVGRDPRDIAWSLHHHMANMTTTANGRLQGAGAPISNQLSDIVTFYHSYIEGRFPPDASVWDYFNGWWEFRQLPNLLMVHFANLVSDRAGSVRQIANFLDIELSEELVQKVIQYTSVDHMRKVSADDAHLKRHFVGGSATFINKGTNGRWRDVLSDDEIAKCDRIAAERLPEDCANWLRTGVLPVA